MNPFEQLASNSSDTQLSVVGAMLYEGVVTQNVDPENKNRVVVKIMSSFGIYESLWASVLSGYVGNNHGVSFVPEIGDLVVVGFLSGNLSTPIVLGSTIGYLETGESQIPPNGGNQEVKTIQTNRGHKIVFTDTAGEESIHVTDKAGNKIILDANAICVQGVNGAVVQIDKDGVVNITTGGDCNVNAANVNIAGDGNLTVGNVPVPPTGFCGILNCIFSGATHTTNVHPIS